MTGLERRNRALTGRDRDRLRVLRALPYAIGVPGPGPGAISNVEGLLDYLERYARHAGAQHEETTARVRTHSRAANVLRSLRHDLENLASTLEELDGDAILVPVCQDCAAGRHQSCSAPGVCQCRTHPDTGEEVLP